MKWLLMFVAVASLFSAGCNKGDSAGEQSGGNPPRGETNISPSGGYAAVQAILSQNCTRCHGDTNPKRGISFTSYEKVMASGVVKSGDPEGSEIIQALKGMNGKKQMPFGGTPLPDKDIATISDWIKAGAKNG